MSKEFITFGFDHKVGDRSLANHYIVIDRYEFSQFCQRTKDGFLEFAFSYPIEMLDGMKEKWDMKEITPDEYKKELVW